ncbi:MAG: DNA repair protein RecO [Candidatus Thiodiazotropha sp.]
MSGPQLSSACVIHRRDYRNTSLLLELFTPEEGRVPAIAKGVKSGRASRAALLQPFMPLQVILQGRGEIKQLFQVEADGRPYPLTGERLYCGFYLNELLMRLLERHDPYPRLYLHYLDTLERLAVGDSPAQCLRHFELDLLQELGYGLLLDHTADSGEPIALDRYYDYELEQGPIDRVSGSSELRIRGRTLLCLHNRDALDAQCADEAKRLLRRILAHYLGDKPLKSRELFQGHRQS